MGPVTIDAGQLIMFGITTLVGLVIYNQRSAMEGLKQAIQKVDDRSEAAIQKALEVVNNRVDQVEKHKVRPLETANQDVVKGFSELRNEVVRQFSDFRVELMRTHPTKQELDHSMHANDDRLKQIETDVRRIMEAVVRSDSRDSRDSQADGTSLVAARSRRNG